MTIEKKLSTIRKLINKEKLEEAKSQALTFIRKPRSKPMSKKNNKEMLALIQDIESLISIKTYIESNDVHRSHILMVNLEKSSSHHTKEIKHCINLYKKRIDGFNKNAYLFSFYQETAYVSSLSSFVTSAIFYLIYFNVSIYELLLSVALTLTSAFASYYFSSLSVVLGTILNTLIIASSLFYDPWLILSQTAAIAIFMVIEHYAERIIPTPMKVSLLTLMKAYYVTHYYSSPLLLTEPDIVSVAPTSHQESLLPYSPPLLLTKPDIVSVASIPHQDSLLPLCTENVEKIGYDLSHLPFNTAPLTGINRSLLNTTRTTILFPNTEPRNPSLFKQILTSMVHWAKELQESSVFIFEGGCSINSTGAFTVTQTLASEARTSHSLHTTTSYTFFGPSHCIGISDLISYQKGTLPLAKEPYLIEMLTQLKRWEMYCRAITGAMPCVVDNIELSSRIVTLRDISNIQDHIPIHELREMGLWIRHQIMLIQEHLKPQLHSNPNFDKLIVSTDTILANVKQSFQESERFAHALIDDATQEAFNLAINTERPILSSIRPSEIAKLMPFFREKLLRRYEIAVFESNQLSPLALD